VKGGFGLPYGSFLVTLMNMHGAVSVFLGENMTMKVKKG
jgi:hypothetical protein